jgi:xylulose-5-phosphate/fructose-6-phosphate phosphoketolase
MASALTNHRRMQTGEPGLALKRRLKDRLFEHEQHIHKNRRDMPEIRDWQRSTPR